MTDDKERLWSPQMRKWVRDARRHGLDISLAKEPRQRRRLGAGQRRGGHASGVTPLVSFVYIANPTLNTVLFAKPIVGTVS